MEPTTSPEGKVSGLPTGSCPQGVSPSCPRAGARRYPYGCPRGHIQRPALRRGLSLVNEALAGRDSRCLRRSIEGFSSNFGTLPMRKKPPGMPAELRLATITSLPREVIGLYVLSSAIFSPQFHASQGRRLYSTLNLSRAALICCPSSSTLSSLPPAPCASPSPPRSGQPHRLYHVFKGLPGERRARPRLLEFGDDFDLKRTVIVPEFLSLTGSSRPRRGCRGRAARGLGVCPFGPGFHSVCFRPMSVW